MSNQGMQEGVGTGSGVTVGDVISKDQLHVVFDHAGVKSYAVAGLEGEFPVPLSSVAFAASMTELEQIVGEMEGLMGATVGDEKSPGVIGLQLPPVK